MKLRVTPLSGLYRRMFMNVKVYRHGTCKATTKCDRDLWTILKLDESPFQNPKSEIRNLKMTAPARHLWWRTDSGALRVQFRTSDFGSEMGFRPIFKILCSNYFFPRFSGSSGLDPPRKSLLPSLKVMFEPFARYSPFFAR